MTFEEYQKQAVTFDFLSSTDAQPHVHDPAFISKILGLVGEAGEVAEKFKKIIRDKQGVMSAEDKASITKELGDVLWYTSVIAGYMGVPFEQVPKTNIEKLSDRKSRGVQKGSGDNR